MKKRIAKKLYDFFMNDWVISFITAFILISEIFWLA